MYICAHVYIYIYVFIMLWLKHRQFLRCCSHHVFFDGDGCPRPRASGSPGACRGADPDDAASIRRSDAHGGGHALPGSASPRGRGLGGGHALQASGQSARGEEVPMLGYLELLRYSFFFYKPPFFSNTVLSDSTDWVVSDIDFLCDFDAVVAFI